MGTVRFVRPHARLGAATGLVAQFRCGLWGWPVTFTQGAARACVARIDRRVTVEQQVCLRTTRWIETVGGSSLAMKPIEDRKKVGHCNLRVKLHLRQSFFHPVRRDTDAH